MRWFWLLALTACGTASEGATTSTASLLGDEEIATDGGAGPVDAAAVTDAGAPANAVDTTPLVPSGPQRRVTYSPDAPFTAFTIVAEAGEELGFLVDARTAGAKPSVWITDNQFTTVLAKKNTGSGSNFVRFTPDRTGIYYLVIREASLKPSNFLISSYGL